MSREDRKTLRNYLEDQDRMGRENVMAAFRQSMVENAPPGEPLAVTYRRVAADPATAEIARRVGCSIEELLEGMGQTEEFWRPSDYDEEAADALVAEVSTNVTTNPIGFNARDGRAERVRHLGAHTAPHVDAQKRRIRGSTRDAQLIRDQMSRGLTARRYKK